MCIRDRALAFLLRQLTDIKNEVPDEDGIREIVDLWKNEDSGEIAPAWLEHLNQLIDRLDSEQDVYKRQGRDVSGQLLSHFSGGQGKGRASEGHRPAGERRKDVYKRQPKDYLACIAYIQQLVSEGEFELMQEESTCPLEKVKTEAVSYTHLLCRWRMCTATLKSWRPVTWM